MADIRLPIVPYIETDYSYLEDDRIEPTLAIALVVSQWPDICNNFEYGTDRY
jgi:hypothetical protein